MPTLRTLPLDSIRPSPHNPRTVFDEQALVSLSESIARLGVLQPILVSRLQGLDGQYEIIAGERRWRASQLAGKKSVPALIYAPGEQVSGADLREIQIAENLERQPLDPIEEALALDSLRTEFGHTQVEIAQRLKRSLGFVRSRLDLLRLCEAVRRLVSEGQITLGAAVEIARVEAPRAQVELAEQAALGRWGAEQARGQVEALARSQRLEVQRRGKSLAMERKATALAADYILVRPSTYDPKVHRRIWELGFEECANCARKGRFLRDDGLIEDVCVDAPCFGSLAERRREEQRHGEAALREDRAAAFARVLQGGEVRIEHLRYLLWCLLGLLGPAADPWRAEHGLPASAEASVARIREWTAVGAWPEEETLTAVLRLVVSYLASLDDGSVPAGLKESLADAFGVPSAAPSAALPCVAPTGLAETQR